MASDSGGTSIGRPERRKEPRFIVSGMQAYVEGIPCAILDISASGVRMLRPDTPLPELSSYTVVFEYEGSDETVRINVTGRPLRQTELFFVLAYDPPHETWEETIRSMDFVDALTRLDLAL